MKYLCVKVISSGFQEASHISPSHFFLWNLSRIWQFSLPTHTGGFYVYILYSADILSRVTAHQLQLKPEGIQLLHIHILIFPVPSNFSLLQCKGECSSIRGYTLSPLFLCHRVNSMWCLNSNYFIIVHYSFSRFFTTFVHLLYNFTTT